MFRILYLAKGRFSIKNLKVQLTSQAKYLVSGQTIDYSIEFPANDYKQIDFITSINRYFNLVIVPNPDKPKTLIIEPLIDYVGKGKVLDWTTKIDDSQPQSLKPTTSLINGTLNFNFKLDQDYTNQNFNKTYNRIFGNEKVKLNQEYKDKNIDFEFMFGSPMDITLDTTQLGYLELDSMSKIESQSYNGVNINTFVPFKVLPKLIFRGNVLPNDNYGYIKTVSGVSYYQTWFLTTYEPNAFVQDRFQELNRFTTYPFNYSGFSHYLNWRGEDISPNLTPEFHFVAEDLYDVYYKDYIEDLLSDENKIYSAKIYLYPEEIQQLRGNEKIIINKCLFFKPLSQVLQSFLVSMLSSKFLRGLANE